MKFTFAVNQAGVVDAGLLGKVGVEDLCRLHYLRGWFIFDGAKIEVVEGANSSGFIPNMQSKNSRSFSIRRPKSPAGRINSPL